MPAFASQQGEIPQVAMPSVAVSETLRLPAIRFPGGDSI
jgi:hypothetical protein